MMELYGKALIAERLKPRQHTELARYVRWEYGPNVGPDFLLAAVAGGTGRGPERSRPLAALVRAMGKAARVIVPRRLDGGRAKAIEAVR